MRYASFAGLARIALGHVRREYPNKPEHVLAGPEDARTPSQLAMLLSGRWLKEPATHMWTATAVASAAVVIVAAQPVPGAVQHSAAPATQAAQKSGPVLPTVLSPAAPAEVQAPITVPVTLPTVQVPKLKLPLPVPARLKNLL